MGFNSGFKWLMNVTGQLQGPAALSPGKEHFVPIEYKAGRDPESGWAL